MPMKEKLCLILLNTGGEDDPVFLVQLDPRSPRKREDDMAQVREVTWEKEYPGPSVVAALAHVDDVRSELQELLLVAFEMGRIHQQQHPSHQLNLEL